jgi:fumarate hydratase class II
VTPASTRNDTRIENDAFGPVQIPADRYWGAQTQRALAVFDVGEERFPACLIHAFGLHKMAAARANVRCGTLAPHLADAIVDAAGELRDGLFDAHFPLTVWQTGSGTQTNMNANEVIANRANERLGQPLGTRSPVHPNDHVNASQSSNDSFPTVMQMVTALELRDRLLPAMALLRDTLLDRAHAFADVLKVARTHLMDAVPMTMGQAFTGFTVQADNGMERIESLTGLPFHAAACKVEGMAAHDVLVEVSGVLNVIATSLLKLANDLRWLGSGPRCGLGELMIPDDGLTSSIMPGKRNPTIAEVAAQAAMQVMGNHVTITMAGASGNFELNVAKPLLIHNVLQSIRILADSTRVLARKLVAGLEANHGRLAANVEGALLAVTALNPVIGYDRAAQITRTAIARDITPRAAAIELGLLSGEDYDRLVDPHRMANGNG